MRKLIALGVLILASMNLSFNLGLYESNRMLESC